jgi:hypothetical protein
MLMHHALYTILTVHNTHCTPYSLYSKVQGSLFDVWAQASMEHIPIMLEGGVRLLVYSGDADYEHSWTGENERE